MPKDVTDKLESAFKKALSDPAVQKNLEQQSAPIIYQGHADTLRGRNGLRDIMQMLFKKQDWQRNNVQTLRYGLLDSFCLTRSVLEVADS